MVGLSEVPLVLRIWRQTFRCNLNTVREQRRRCVPEILLKGRVELPVVCIVEKPIQLNVHAARTYLLTSVSPLHIYYSPLAQGRLDCVLSPSKTIVYSFNRISCFANELRQTI